MLWMFPPKEVLWKRNLTNLYLRYLLLYLSCVWLEPLEGMIYLICFIDNFSTHCFLVLLLMIYSISLMFWISNGVFVNQKYYYLALDRGGENQFNPRNRFLVISCNWLIFFFLLIYHHHHHFFFMLLILNSDFHRL